MRVAVVGAGIAGLAAAHRLAGGGAEVVVVEQATRAGGKLRTGSLAGGVVEAGAEAFLVRDAAGERSAAVELAHSLGLGDALVHPATNLAAVAVDGRLRPLPGGTLFGVPSNLSTLDGVAEPDAALDRDGGHPLLAAGEDQAVGALVRRRLGDQVVDRLVDPLLGGVYAGRADDLSLAVTIPALAAACRRATTLTGAVAQALASRSVSGGGPVFATVEGGMSRLVDALVAALRGRGAVLRFGVPVRDLRRDRTRWRLIAGSTRDAEPIDVDAVVLAVPARPAARLLSTVDEQAGATVGLLDYASVALVALAFPAMELPPLSGFLVPATEGYATKAVTFVTGKWDHLRRQDGVVVVRASLGRYGEEHVLQRDDVDLVALVRRELAALLGAGGAGGAALPAPVGAAVWRWGGALPQYAPDHLDRARAVRAALPPAIALAGAALDGVGIPACVRSGQVAADAVLADLGQLRT
jgi:protoporphyrinogen/coproporphyrinogen III oxidase